MVSQTCIYIVDIFLKKYPNAELSFILFKLENSHFLHIILIYPGHLTLSLSNILWCRSDKNTAVTPSKALTG